MTGFLCLPQIRLEMDQYDYISYLRNLVCLSFSDRVQNVLRVNVKDSQNIYF